LKLYEFGKIYSRKEGTYQEESRLALYITGNRETENWQNKTQPVSFYDIAQHLQQIFVKSGAIDIKQESINDQLFDYGVKFFRAGTLIGKAGKVKVAILKDFGIKQELFYAELNSALLFQNANPKLVIQEISKFPEVRRDLSLVLDKGVSYDEIKNLILSTEGKIIKSIIAFDVYEGANIPFGKKAYALGFTLLNESKTLTDEEIDKTMEKLISAFEKQLGAVIRK
jgi:phenylalanyl-tRNA synthetase beta chain